MTTLVFAADVPPVVCRRHFVFIFPLYREIDWVSWKLTRLVCRKQKELHRGDAAPDMVEDDFFVVLFNTLHHLLQQWAEAEEKDCCCTSHDGEEREEVGEIRDLESEEGVYGLFCCGEQGC